MSHKVSAVRACSTPRKIIRVVVHGDDFTALGSKSSLDWLREVIQHRMEVKFKGRLERRRPGAVRILSRIVTVASGGLEYEADERHAAIITSGSNGEGGQDVKGDRNESRFRAVAARGKLLGSRQDGHAGRCQEDLEVHVQAGGAGLEGGEAVGEVPQGSQEGCVGV